MAIKKLPESLINQIAAGEVVERPFSVVKELVENSIDAGATSIDVFVNNGGKTLIKIVDNGCGIKKDELLLAIERHATSKLEHENLMKIKTMGFRGEALPSIGSVSRMKIKSRIEGEEAWEISVEGGKIEPIRPAACEKGTVIEVRDLFFAVPARLKFLKTDRIEKDAILDVLERIALANPNIAIQFVHDGKNVFQTHVNADYEKRQLIRISEILGQEFSENALEVEYFDETCKVSGYASLPTLHRAYNRFQYFFVNGRPVKDKVLLAAAKIAYQDFVPHGRYPMLVIFIEIAEEEVDVNVHPAKTEVRFRNSNGVRDAVRRGLREMLQNIAHRATSTNMTDMVGFFEKNISFSKPAQPLNLNFSQRQFATSYHQLGDPGESFDGFESKINMDMPPQAKTISEESQAFLTQDHYPLGAAKAQIHKNYIIAQNEKGLVIVDQHAAHERLVYEKMKRNIEANQIERQMLLVPETVELSDADASLLLEHQTELEQYGLVVEPFGVGTILVREVPVLIQKGDFKALIKDLVDELRHCGAMASLKNRIDFVCATMACHGSVRSGRILNLEEMNQLLREMEKTPFSGQCNHGRPTYIELDLNQIEKLFGRQM